MPTSRIALGIEYDGRPFCGWQSQAERCGVQDALERAIAVLAGAPVTLNAAGRTDQGVHASLQVAHFETEAQRPLSAWVRGVNAELPDAIAVKWARAVVPEFHARFSARRRAYHYLLMNRPERPGLLAGRVGWAHRPLDPERMRLAAHHLVGEHDFSSFRSAQCQAKSPIKNLQQLSIGADGSLLTFEFVADAFLQHMVRNIIGALVLVGNGAQPPQWVAEILAARDRAHAAPTFMPDGLYLSGIEYDPRFGLPDTAPRHPWTSAP
ncbi:MAG: tRNA pseudouridine(38-40) synthase TruA [Betaproteobacteria bacterium]